MFTLEFKTGNAAFCDPYTGEEDDLSARLECRRILLAISEAIADGKSEGSVIDYNGNKIGRWELN